VAPPLDLEEYAARDFPVQQPHSSSSSSHSNVLKVRRRIHPKVAALISSMPQLEAIMEGNYLPQDVSSSDVHLDYSDLTQAEKDEAIMHVGKYTFEKFFVSVAESGKQNLMRFLLKNNLKPNITTLDKAISGAVKNNHQNIIEEFLSCASRSIKFTERAFIAAAENSNINILNFIAGKNLKITPYAFDVAFIKSAENGHLNILEWLIDNGCDIDQARCDVILGCAVKHNRLDVISWMVGKNLSPNQSQIDETFNKIIVEKHEDCVDILELLWEQNIRPSKNILSGYLFKFYMHKNIDKISWLLSTGIQPDESTVDKASLLYTNPQSRLDFFNWIMSNKFTFNQECINRILLNAATRDGVSDVISWMVGNNLSPTQDCIDNAYVAASESNNLVMLQGFLDNNLRINSQESINRCYSIPAINAWVEVLQLLHANRIIADDYTILASYRRARAVMRDINYPLENAGRIVVSEFLEQTFPNIITQEVINQAAIADINQLQYQNYNQQDNNWQNNAPRIATEVHSFTGIEQDIALSKMIARLGQAGITNAEYIAYGDAVALVRSACERLGIQINERINFYLNTEAKDYQDVLCTTSSFVQKFHNDKFDTWVNAFVRESLTAYSDDNSSSLAAASSSSGSTTCNSGFWERMITGMRDVNDEELNEIFKDKEKALYGRTSIAHFISPTVMAGLMGQSGLHLDCTFAQAKAKMHEILAGIFAGEDNLLSGALDSLNALGVSEIIFTKYTGREAPEEETE